MNLLDLFVKIGVDDQASGKIGDIASKLGDGLKTAAKVGVAAVSAAATGIAALTTAAVKNYAEYEQLVGGVETLFGTASEKVQEYASKAYETAGVSANEYMQTVTSFSASLLQSLGRGAQTNLDELEATLDAEYKATKQGLEDQVTAVKRAWEDRIALAKENGDENITELKRQKEDELTALKRANKDQLAELKAYNDQRLAEAEAANEKSVTTAETQALAAEKANQAIIDMSDKMLVRLKSIELYQRCGRNPANGKSPNGHKTRAIPCQAA